MNDFYDISMKILPWILSMLTILHQYIAGSGKKKAWALAFITESLWLYWSYQMKIWGLMPMSICLLVVYLRNWKAV